MNTFEVLVVDDELDITDLVADHFEGHPQIRIHTANTFEEAENHVATKFLHLAFVDMQLRPNVANGLLILNRLRDDRPSCRSVMLTKYPGEYRKELFALFDPLYPAAIGAIDKAQLSPIVTNVIEDLAKRWLCNRRSVECPTIVEKVIAKVPKGPAHVTVNEIDYVLSSVLGQGLDLAQSSEEAEVMMQALTLTELEGGRSRSVVGAGRPTDKQGHEGIWCVFKIGPRAEIEEEYTRYRAYVRYAVAVSHRVELLGHSLADTVGAICYSFAGKSPTSVTSLYSLFRNSDPAALSFIEQIFSIENQELYKRRSAKRSLGEYFHKIYELDSNKIVKDATLFIDGLTNAGYNLGEVPHASIYRLNEAFASAQLRKATETCIVHGDMNANNVMVTTEDDMDKRVIYIDYSHTGVGPRAVDFAALEGSLRLATCPEDLNEVMRMSRSEAGTLRTAWRDGSPRRGPDAPYCSRIGDALARLARDNFPDMDRREYAATCFLWAARLFRVIQLKEWERLRMLLWMLQSATDLSG